MPRIPRSYIQTIYYHIMTQGLNKNYIFEDEQDIKFYINIMYKLKKDYKINILAYCIMNNHAHILIETQTLKNLCKYMHRLNTTFGKYYNNKYERVGYVFRDRYKAEGIYSEKHLAHCIDYIYNNPVKAGICKAPSEYPHSNYHTLGIDIDGSEYSFLDIPEDTNIICKDIIENFLKENNLTLITLKENKKYFRELIIILRNQCNISFRKIAEVLKSNRETVRRLYNR